MKLRKKGWKRGIRLKFEQERFDATIKLQREAMQAQSEETLKIHHEAMQAQSEERKAMFTFLKKFMEDSKK